ncbi:MAG: pyridoxal phosphate-dependent aminotransferase [Nitrospirae bacterium]|nr:pyridoxal phosphate-dependent aminotransferase [Nitrospirota bacterium]
MKLAGRIGRIKPSPTLAMTAKAKTMKAQGIDVIDFGVGEPDFDTPDDVKEEAIKAIRSGFTKYTAPSGTDELKDAIIEKFKKDNSLEYERSQIIVSCGAKHSLYNIAQVLFEAGDEVIIPSPYWVSYPDQIILNDGIPVFVKTEEKDQFKLKAKALKKHITPRTKAIILNSPSNPTGSAYEIKDLEEIAEIALRHNTYIISDEIYEKIVYDGFRHVSIASLGKELKNLTILVNGVSKSHSMTGWRIGYTAGPKEIITAMSNLQSQSTSNPTSISQKAAVAALKGSDHFVNMMVSEFDKRRRYIVDRLNKMKGVKCLMPQGAFYAFPNVSSYYGKSVNNRKISGSLDLATYLLEEAKIAAVSGDSFGADEFIRFSYATSMENIKKGLDRMEEALGKIK